ncbi:polysaccharide biosynthesis/export family protein [Litoribacter alkaliphilus]|uniref:Polysaccharide biosynthesis/export family protein n=1 Tax=Litoribacter ruber TaxID=702568 RepID=A0AAP2G6B4_9BACT|nr:polysaccharide biosynthesis/export family protein [Litoribacter alkaliphilus]MBS9525891.1 polysaccharide biosynthesis/export family protein [Litoribacter alkaliphilus]
MKLLQNILLVILLAAAASCVQNKKLIYLQNADNDPEMADGQLISYEMPDYRLQYNDIIDVKVQTRDEQVNKEFSGFADGAATRMAGQLAQGGGDIYYMTGYSVNKVGEIRLPILGTINVQDKTLEEVRLLVEEELKSYAKNDVFVKVKLGGIRYSALGEFRRPGKFVVLQDRMTILEAIANAGDLTTVAQRDEVVLIRQYPEGTRVHRLNLRDRNLIRSPYYFIQPNDQIYAEPMRVREFGTGENAAQSLSIFITSLTAVALVLNLITN